MPDPLYNQIVRDVQSDIRDKGWWQASCDFAFQLSKEYRQTVLLLVIDLCMVDGEFHKNEMKVVGVLIRVFDLDQDYVLRICKIFMDKYGIEYVRKSGPLEADKILDRS